MRILFQHLCKVGLSEARFSSTSAMDPFKAILLSENKAKAIQKFREIKPLLWRGIPTCSDKHSAILVPLCEVNNEISILYTVRSQNISQGGQVSFPGGAADPGDVDVIHTALRETEEEIGIPSTQIDVWTDFTPMKDYRLRQVHPVIGFINNYDPSKLIINEEEVATVFTRTIRELCDPNNVEAQELTYKILGKRTFVMPSFPGEHTIWGFTAVITHQVLQTLVPEHYAGFLGMKKNDSKL